MQHIFTFFLKSQYIKQKLNFYNNNNNNFLKLKNISFKINLNNK